MTNIELLALNFRLMLIKFTVNEFYDGSIKKLVKKLKETGFKADLENMDYILVEDGGNDIVKTNSLAL